MIVPELAKLFAPWNSLYGGSKVLSTAVTTVHVLSLLFAGGFAIAADRATIRALKRPPEHRHAQLRELRAVHRPVLVAVTLLFVSGLVMAAADVETYATSAYFWVKMGLIVLLMLNGLFMLATEQRLSGLGRAAPAEAANGPALWRRLHRVAAASVALWTLTTVAGTVLTGMA